MGASVEPSRESHSDDRQLLSKWVDEHADALYRFALTKLQNDDVIEDLLQETYLAALRGYKGFRGEASIRTWLIGILRIKIADYRRKQFRNLPQADISVQDLPVREDRLSDWDISDSSTIEKAEFWSTLERCLSKLPDSLVAAYTLREVDDKSATQVCDILGISAQNLAVRLYRARALLRECLDRNWFQRKSM